MAAAIIAAVMWLLLAVAGIGVDVIWMVGEQDSRLLTRDLVFSAPVLLTSALMTVLAIRILARRARGTVAAGVISLVGGLVILGSGLLIDHGLHLLVGVGFFVAAIVGLAGSGAYAKRRAAG